MLVGAMLGEVSGAGFWGSFLGTDERRAQGWFLGWFPGNGKRTVSELRVFVWPLFQ
jgi:hypothetical protein